MTTTRENRFANGQDELAGSTEHRMRASTSPRDSGIQTRLRRGGFWIFAGRSLGMATVFVTVALLAKWLPKTEFAAYVVTAGLVTLISVAGSLGLNYLICRYIAALFALDDGDQARQIAIRIGIWGTASAAVASGVFWFIAPGLAHAFLCPPLVQFRLIIAIWIFLLTTSQIVAEAFRGIHNLFAAGLLAGISGGLLANGQLLVGIVALHVFNQLSYATVMWLCVGSFLLPTLGGGCILFISWPSRSLNRLPSTRPVALPIRSVLWQGIPIMLVNLIALGFDQSGQLISKSWGNSELVSVFEAVWRLAMIGIIPLTMLGLAAASTMSELWALKERERLERLMQGISTLSCIVTILPLIALALGANRILGVVFQADFAVGAPALVLLCGVQSLRNWAGPCDMLLIMTGHQVWAFLCFVVALPILALGPWAIDRGGIMGITLIVAIAITVARLCQYAVVRRILAIRPHANFSPGFMLQMFQFLAPRYSNSQT